MEESLNFEQVKLTSTLQNVLDTTETVAFAIIKDGKLLYESYWQGYDYSSHTNSVSMVKTVTTMLYFQAMKDGYIGSVDEPIIKWLRFLTSVDEFSLEPDLGQYVTEVKKILDTMTIEQ